MKRIIFVTGQPGVGKTTIIMNAVTELRRNECKVGGVVSIESREEGIRVGFELVDLATSRKGWLAHVKQSTGPRVGKYRVNIDQVDHFGATAIRNAMRDADVVVIDEIGPMELFSAVFKQAIKEALDSDKLILGVVHHKTRDPLVDSIRRRNDSEILEVTLENRADLHKILIQKAIEFLRDETRKGN